MMILLVYNVQEDERFIAQLTARSEHGPANTSNSLHAVV